MRAHWEKKIKRVISHMCCLNAPSAEGLGGGGQVPAGHWYWLHRGCIPGRQLHDPLVWLCPGTWALPSSPSRCGPREPQMELISSAASPLCSFSFLPWHCRSPLPPPIAWVVMILAIRLDALYIRTQSLFFFGLGLPWMA